MTIFITIEGNIGSGKSSLLMHLKHFFNKENINVGYIDEPVAEWDKIKDSHGTTILSKYYADQKQYAFAFQMMAYISRLVKMQKVLESNYDVVIMERTMITDKEVFAKMLYDEGKLQEIEYQIYNLWFDAFIGNMPDLYYIYVKTTPVVASNRVQLRNRIGESISIDYLIKCNDYHDKWLNQIPRDKILTINSNQYFDSDQYEYVCELVYEFISSRLSPKKVFTASYDMC